MDALENTIEIEEYKEVSLSSLSAKTIVKSDDKKTATCESADGEKSAGPSTKTTRLPVPTSNSFTRNTKVSPHKSNSNKTPSKIPRSQSLKRNENDSLAKSDEINEPKKEVGKKEKELNSEVKTAKKKPEPIIKKSLSSNKSSDSDSESASMKSCESVDAYSNPLSVTFDDAEQDIWDDTVTEEVPNKETELKKTEKTKVVKIIKDKEPRKNVKSEESPKLTKEKETREPAKEEVPKALKSKVPRKIISKKSKEKDLLKTVKDEDSSHAKEKGVVKTHNEREHHREIKDEKSIHVLKNVEKLKSVKEYDHQKENKSEDVHMKIEESSHLPKIEETSRAVKNFHRTQKKEEPTRESVTEKLIDDTTENETFHIGSKEKKNLSLGKNEKPQTESKNRKSLVVKEKEQIAMTTMTALTTTTKDVENFRTKDKETDEKEISNIERDKEIKKKKSVEIESNKLEEKSSDVMKHHKMVERKKSPKIMTDEESKKVVEMIRKVRVEEKLQSEMTDGKSISSLRSFETSEEKSEREREAEEKELERQKRVINTLYDVTKHTKRCVFDNMQGLDKFLKEKTKSHVMFPMEEQDQQSQETNPRFVQESYDNTLREITEIWKNTISLVGSVKDHTHKFVDEKNAFIDKEQLTLEAEMLQLAVDFAVTYSKLKTDFLLSGILKHVKVKILEKSELENFLEWKAFVAQYNDEDLAAMAKTVLELKTSILRSGELETE